MKTIFLKKEESWKQADKDTFSLLLAVDKMWPAALSSSLNYPKRTNSELEL